MQDFIDQLWCGALVGCALSLVAAAGLSQPVRLTASSILARLLLVATPIYLGVNYLFYQDRLLVTGAGTSFALCLYWFRGWWLPEHSFEPELRPPSHGIGAFSFPPAKRQAGLASTALRDRVHQVVRGDRRQAKAA